MAVNSRTETGLPGRSVLAAFALFVILAGGSAVAIRFTYGELAPFWSASIRFGLAALIFWILVLVKKIPFPSGLALLGVVAFGALTIGLGFLLVAWGLVETPASLAQILMALVPLMTLLLSSVQGLEALTRRGVLGAVMAIAGIAVAVGGGSVRDISLVHAGAIIVATIVNSEGVILLKKFPPTPPIMTNAIGMTIGSLFLIVASLATGEAWVVPSQRDTLLAMGYLVFVVTIGVFMLYLFVLRNWTASGASYGFVLMPLVTIVVASTLAGEQITAGFLVGSVLVLAGVLVGALLPSKQKPDALEECKDTSGQALPNCM